MAVVQGVKERVHLPIYDAARVKPEEQLGEVLDSNTLKFFVDVQGKTKLETNLQAAGLLPHFNTFEARAMRVVVSDLPAAFPAEPTATPDDQPVTDGDDKPLGFDTGTGKVVTGTNVTAANSITASIELGLSDLIDLLQQARDSNDGTVDIPMGDDFIKEVHVGTTALNDAQIGLVTDAGGKITLADSDLEDLLYSNEFDDVRPPDEQIEGNGGSAKLLSKVIYNTVTTLYVGEKVMIEMPTWFFPAGAGVYSENGSFTTHGEPNPTATFRFAEPIYIDKQQNFRVEIVVPDSDTLKELQQIYGPLLIWVVLDGYMTRDVQ